MLDNFPQLKGGDITLNAFTEQVRKDLIFLQYAPIVFLSALTGFGIEHLLDTVEDVAANHALRIGTGQLNKIITDAITARPYTNKGKTFRVYYTTMAAVKPPTIVLMCNDPEMLHFSYRRYLENQIRQHFGYEGTPIRILARNAEKEKREPEARKKAVAP